MAEIQIAAMTTTGPPLPTSHAAWLEDYSLCGNTVKRLVLSIGDCTIHVWPADAESINKLGKRLQYLSTLVQQ